jgi:hypothetical protein
MGIGNHQTPIGNEQEWLTPEHIIAPLGEFDLDPCAPVKRMWDTANNYYTILDDGLLQKWFGRVWMNPPYHRYQIGQWMQKMALHGDGIALTFARTDTRWFHDYIFETADSLFFLDGRITFCYPDGTKAKANGGAPNVLISYGKDNMEMLHEYPLPGKHLPINQPNIIVVGISPTWFSVVSMAINQVTDKSLAPIYEMVERIAPDKVAGNKHYKEKIRQQLYILRKRKTINK